MASYLFGSTRTHADIMARLALAAKREVVGIDYRLAPEHPYPAAPKDALSAYGWLVDRVETMRASRPCTRISLVCRACSCKLATPSYSKINAAISPGALPVRM